MFVGLPRSIFEQASLKERFIVVLLSVNKSSTEQFLSGCVLGDGLIPLDAVYLASSSGRSNLDISSLYLVSQSAGFGRKPLEEIIDKRLTKSESER